MEITKLTGYFSSLVKPPQANKFSTIGAKSAIKKGRRSTIFKATVFPFWRFVRNYFFKFGFMDGYYGLIISVIISHENFLKYIKMIEIQRRGDIQEN